MTESPTVFCNCMKTDIVLDEDKKNRTTPTHQTLQPSKEDIVEGLLSKSVKKKQSNDVASVEISPAEGQGHNNKSQGHGKKGEGQVKLGEKYGDELPEILESEHEDYIYIKYKDDKKQCKGKSNFLSLSDEPVASSSQTGNDSHADRTPENFTSHATVTTQGETSDLLDDDDDLIDGTFDDFEDALENINEYGRLHRHLRNLGDTDSLILQFLQDLDPNNLSLTARHLLGDKPEEPSYPCNKKIKGICQICLEEDIDVRTRLCCDVPVCEPCQKEYLKNEVEQRNVRLQCINCDSYVHRDEILSLLPIEQKEKYYRFLLDENKDSNVKTCPRCCYLQNRKDILPNSDSTSPKKKKKRGSTGLKVMCSRCGIAWCFDCHAPWHENIKCREYQKGDKLVKNWAKEFSFGIKNAVRCPKCKVYIHKKSGCDHMTCRNCNTSFCYRCGHRYIQMKLIGKHSDRYSPFGCKYNLLPDNPVPRKALRGTVLGAKIFGGVLLGGLIVAAAAVFIGGSVIFVPTYFGIKYYHWRKRQKVFRNYRRQREQVIQHRIQQANKGTTTVAQVVTARADVALEVPFSDNSDTMTSTESSSSNDHHRSTEVKVWVHSENEEKQVDLKYKTQEQQTTPGSHDNTITTAEVTMEDDLVVLHVKTTNKKSTGEGTVAEQEVDGSNISEVKKADDKSIQEKSDDPKSNGHDYEVNVDSQGCFVKILGKLPVKWEKEEEKDVKLKETGITVSKPVIVKDKKKKIGTRRNRNLYDVSDSEKSDNYEKASKCESCDNLSEIQQDKLVCDDIDPYLGVVSMETCDTVF